VYAAARMRQASVVRSEGRLAVISWLGGTVSIVPFAAEWFSLPEGAVNWALLGALASSAALGFAIALSPPLRRVVVVLAGPHELRARALVLVAVFAAGGALAMLAVLWLSSR
jgi:hypothetical protein